MFQSWDQFVLYIFYNNVSDNNKKLYTTKSFGIFIEGVNFLFSNCV